MKIQSDTIDLSEVNNSVASFFKIQFLSFLKLWARMAMEVSDSLLFFGRKNVKMIEAANVTLVMHLMKLTETGERDHPQRKTMTYGTLFIILPWVPCPFVKLMISCFLSSALLRQFFATLRPRHLLPYTYAS